MSSLEIAQFATELRLDRLPPETVATARRLCLDTLAVAWAGTDAPGIREARDLAVEAGGRAESTILASAHGCPAPEAAFVNGAAAAALDYDTVHPESILHADAVVFPAALAVAERTGASGREFLAAFIAGIEIAHRLALATPRRSGWFHSSAVGVFGAAAAAARLLRLDPAKANHALGIALSMSGGTKQAIVERTLTKRLQTAFAARAGVQAALLAQRGITGPQHWLDGEYGWLRQYESGDPAAITADLGTRFVFAATGIKKFPSCLCNHAAIDAAIELARSHDLDADDIAQVRVKISPYMFRIVGAPYDPGADSQVAAQFSIQYGVACALLRRRIALGELDDRAARAPAMVDFARRVVVEVDESWPGHLAPAAIAVDSRRHGALTRQVDVVPGSPGDPVTAEELHAKVEDCMSRGAMPLSREAAGLLTARIERLDDFADMARLFDGIVTDTQRGDRPDMSGGGRAAARAAGAS